MLARESYQLNRGCWSCSSACQITTFTGS
uniref:Uncharacterized protein n=1 Tax=Rhizophora mucronata TaxID=61149 RepID=A0A2P2NRR1_RHIMU